MLEVSISIITPLLNGIQFIEACINNVIEQQCPSAEHIIIDGGSTDGTVDVIRRYAERYPHIRWISEQDGGQSDAMNKGIAMARGDILSFLNVDDFYESNTLNVVLEYFKDIREPAILVGNCNVWGNNGELLWINKPAHLEIIQLLTGDESRFPFPVNPAAYFYHKSLHNIVGLYDIHEHYIMDLDFILKAALYSKPFYLDKVFGNFRYIDGTKSVEFMRSTSAQSRISLLIKTYRKHLLLSQKLELWFLIAIGKLRR